MKAFGSSFTILAMFFLLGAIAACRQQAPVKSEAAPVHVEDEPDALLPEELPPGLQEIGIEGVVVTVPADWTAEEDQGWLRIYGSLDAPIILRKPDTPPPKTLDEAVALWGTGFFDVKLVEGEAGDGGLFYGIIEFEVGVGMPEKNGKNYHMLVMVQEAHASLVLDDATHVHCSFHCGPDCPESSVKEALEICRTMKKAK